MAYSADTNPLEVVLKNVGALTPIVLLFLGWLGATRKKMAQKNAPAPPSASPARDEDERTRRVKEEVRRKIAERQAAKAAPARREIPPEAARPPTRRLAGGVTEVFVPANGEAPAVDYSAEQARQERLSKEMAVIDAGLPPPIASHQAYAPPPASPPPALGWLAALRDPLNVRRAIILREVLGPPVGLR
jgi:hypothetical protein